jgi:integrase
MARLRLVGVESIREDLVGDIDAWIEDSIDRLGRDRYSAAKQARIVLRFARESGVRSLEEISARLVTAWLARIGHEGAASQTRANALSAIRSFVRWAVEVERLDANPLELVRLARRERSGQGASAFTADEVAALVAIARRDIEESNLRLSKGADLRATLYLVLATTGLRIGEARTQRWADVDLERRSLVVTRDKARRRDSIPLCEEAVEVLRWWRSRCEGPLVFAMVPTHRTLERDMRRCGIESGAGQWHRFRKAAITIRAEAGVPMWDLTRLARHVDPRTTLRYVTARDEALARAAEAMPRLVVETTLSLEGRESSPESTRGSRPGKMCVPGGLQAERSTVLPAASRGSAKWSRGDSIPRTEAEPQGPQDRKGSNDYGTTEGSQEERHRLE